MALEDNGMNPMVMPVSPMNGNNGMFGNNDMLAWLFLFLIVGGNGLWGNNGGNNGGFPNQLYPWMNQSENVNSGFSNLAAQLCNGFASVQNSIATGFATSQNANMQQAFNMQTAMTQAINALMTQLSNCCCENRLATANLQSTILQENCADRAAVSDGVRDILTAIANGFQALHNERCQDKIDAKNDEIANLRTQINLMGLANSQAQQTAQFIADNAAQTDRLIQRIAPNPVPSWTVPNPYAYMTQGCNGQCYGC